VLEAMANREEGAIVVKLPREPGKRESRYQYLFCGEVDIESLPVASEPVGDNSRIQAL
jgi:uncharacterized protein YceH (UPF0502 family)